MSHPLVSMGVTNARPRKAPMCLTRIRDEQRGQFSPGVRACGSVMPCSRAEIQLSFRPGRWDKHQKEEKRANKKLVSTWSVGETHVTARAGAEGRGLGSSWCPNTASSPQAEGPGDEHRDTQALGVAKGYLSAEIKK